MFVRGQTDFKAAAKATASFTDDGINAKTSLKLTGILGVPIPLSKKGPDGSAITATPGAPAYSSLELVPYIGINHDFSKVVGKDRTITSDDWRLGVDLVSRTVSRFGTGDSAWSLNSVVEIRPEYLFDDKTHAQIASVNLRYLPVAQRLFGMPVGLNAYRRILPDHDYFFSYKPIFDIRFNNGTFAKRGTRTLETSTDFSRIGTQFGFAISHDNPRIPIDLSVTETILYGLSGYPRWLDQFKTNLSIGFDSNSYFGIDIGYVRGRREDLASREQKWSIGFSARY